jgi:hypothetical protein
MTIEDIYQITQEISNTYECIQLGWFEKNIPLKECWKSKTCYYLTHDEYNLTLFYLVKNNGKFERNIVVISSFKDFEQKNNPSVEVISLHDICEINGVAVKTNHSNFDNGWLLQWERFKSNIDYWKDVSETQFETKFSSQFSDWWLSVLKEIIEYRDLEKVYEVNKGYIHKTALSKIISNLRDICNSGQLYTRHWVEKGENRKKDLELFSFLCGIFEELA